MGIQINLSEPYPAYFLPFAPTETYIDRAGAAEVEFAKLRSNDIGRISTMLIEARSKLLKRSVWNIAEALSQVALIWLSDPVSFGKAVHAAEKVTGYSAQTVELGLRRLLERLHFNSIKEMLTEELPDPSALDGWIELKSGKRLRLLGHPLTLHILAGNIPGLGIANIACALLAKSSSLLKVSSDEPVLTPMFARMLCSVDEELALCVAIANWRGGDEEIESAAFRYADAVVAYGSMETILSIRNRMPPTKRLIAYGHKVGIGIVDAHCNLSDAANHLAIDIAVFDQQGCMSPQVTFVLGSHSSAAEFASLLSSALKAASYRLPVGRLTVERASSIQNWRMVYMMSGAKVIASERSTDWTVILLNEPLIKTPYAHHIACPPRIAIVRGVETPSELHGELHPFRGFLSTAGCELCDACREELLELLAQLGISRICKLGEMQLPRSWWFHDGRPNVADMLIWIGDSSERRQIV